LKECPPDHLNGCFVTSSRDFAMDLWKLHEIVPNCSCKEVLKRNGASVGGKMETKKVF